MMAVGDGECGPRGTGAAPGRGLGTRTPGYVGGLFAGLWGRRGVRALAGRRGRAMMPSGEGEGGLPGPAPLLPLKAGLAARGV